MCWENVTDNYNLNTLNGFTENNNKPLMSFYSHMMKFVSSQ